MSYRLTREERLYLQFMFAVMNRLIEVCPSYLADMTNTVTGCVLEAWQMEHGTQSLAQLEQLALPAGFALDFVSVRGAPWAPAAMLDGIFLMTQVDVPWREDVFRGWHFYDISACAEMRRAGHGIAILRQDTPWFAHCSGNIKVNMAYHYWRAVFLQTYKEELAAWQQAT